MTTPSLHVPLQKPPQALSLTVRRVLGKVQSGEVRVPDFQRPLRWRAADVVKLFDSILKGYPIGSLLFWKRSAPADERLGIGGAHISVPAVADAWYIVDGQQRTTALAAALLDLDHAGDTRWSVRFDPASSSFLSGPPEASQVGRHVPLSALGDIRRLGRWLRDSTLDDALQARVEEAQQRILDYELPVYLMDAESPEPLMGVFDRLNSTGARMRPDEVFQALLGTRSLGRGALNLNELQRACDLDGFGEPPRAEIHKCVLAMSGHDPSRRLEDLPEGSAESLVGAFEAREALARVVEFLQASPDAPLPGAGIPAYGFIPYPVVFVLLSRWFHVFPESMDSAAARRDLSRWVWRGVIGSAHQRAAVSEMRKQARLIQEGQLEGSLSALLESVGEPMRVDWALRPFHTKSAASRVELLALLALGPRDRREPVSWRSLLSNEQRVAREVFASRAWQSLSQETQRRARSAANRVLLDARHTGLVAELRRWSLESDREALASHLIDEVALQALAAHDAPAFLAHRGEKLRVVVNQFLTRRAGLGQPRVQPISAYLEPDEATDSPALDFGHV
ncbi:MAG: GmrSD restriction endonuclease domain-containing protein [Bradymonadia bacterium]